MRKLSLTSQFGNKASSCYYIVLANVRAIGEEGEAKVFSIGTETQVRLVFL